MAAKKKKGDDDEKGKSKGKKFAPVIALVVAAAGYKFVLAPKPAAEVPVDGTVAAAAVALEEGAIVTMPELVLNLAGAETHYLRVGAALVLEKGVDPAAFETEIPLASDVLVEVLSSKTPAELREPGAKVKLKEELSTKVREAYDDEKVVRVVFTTFVMQ
jgi:flagellar basal body-associated protein FliL